MHNRTVLIIVLAVLATLACTLSGDLLQQVADVAQDVDQPAPPAPTADAVEVTPLPLPTEPVSSPTALPDVGAVPDDVAEQMDQIEQEVVQLRGLQPSSPVERGLLSPEGLRQYVIDDFFEDYSEQEARDDVQTLALLGLIDPQFDLIEFYRDLYSEQIAGFYDDELKQMFVVQGAGFGGPERITYAHEYTHALQDQIWDLREGLGFSDEACEADSEACAAVQAMVEGDATLLEERWLVTFGTDQDFEDLRQFYNSFESPVFDSAPAYLQEDFIFPYDAGYRFVESFFSNGGWAAVDALYSDPPVSTEQILHPERYPDDVPLRLEVPDMAPTLGAGWSEIDRDVLGEWYTRLTLMGQLSSNTASPAAAGWGGDYFVSFYDQADGLGALVLVSAWDNLSDAHEFYATFRDYGQLRYGEPTESSTTRTVWDGSSEWATIELAGDQTLWITAPDSSVGQLLRQAVAFPASVLQ